MMFEWPWPNTETEPDWDAPPPMPADLAVFPTDVDDTPALLGPDGEPIRWVPRHPVGFALPTQPEETR